QITTCQRDHDIPAAIGAKRGAPSAAVTDGADPTLIAPTDTDSDGAGFRNDVDGNAIAGPISGRDNAERIHDDRPASSGAGINAALANRDRSADGLRDTDVAVAALADRLD